MTEPRWHEEIVTDAEVGDISELGPIYSPPPDPMNHADDCDCELCAPLICVRDISEQQHTQQEQRKMHTEAQEAPATSPPPVSDAEEVARIDKDEAAIEPEPAPDTTAAKNRLIRQYDLPFGSTTLQLAIGADVIGVGMSYGSPVIWAIVDPAIDGLELHRFEIIQTGANFYLDELHRGNLLGTVWADSDMRAYHIFYLGLA